MADGNSTRIEVRPNPGPQETFLSCTADIAVYGGAMGGGKSWALLLDQLRAVDDPHFRGVLFRRTVTNITKQDGLLDESRKLYPHWGGRLVQAPVIEWRFPSGAKIQLSHLQHEHTVSDHQGAQYHIVGFDELTEFEESQFWFLFGRCRNASGSVKPYMRGSCNPDASSWVRKLLDWWIGDDGYPIPERSGVIRWLARMGDEYMWVDEDWIGPRGQRPVSFTFIAATLEDNPKLTEHDPGYHDRIAMQDDVGYERFARGNWNIVQKDGLFEDHQIDRRGIHPSELPEGIQWVRYWDIADTEPNDKNKDPCATAGALLGLHIDESGQHHLYLRDMRLKMMKGARKKAWMRDVAIDDGDQVTQAFEQEGGSSGSEAADDYIDSVFAGFTALADRPTGDKVARASTWVTPAARGRFHIVQHDNGQVPDWVPVFLAEVNIFPQGKKDQVDAVSGAYKILKSGLWGWSM